ncbi:unnamed protein product, partial [Staurois parvus]
MSANSYLDYRTTPYTLSKFICNQGRTDNSWGPLGNRGSWGPCVLAQLKLKKAY